MVGRRGKKRLGVFEASEASLPTFSNERPVSVDEGLRRRETNAQHPGEAVVSFIDEMTAFASNFLLTRELQGDAIEDMISDSPEGFATRILLASGSVRHRVMNLAPEAQSTAILLRDALELAASYHALRMEFVEGPSTAMGQVLGEAQSNGGLAKHAKCKRRYQERHETWQREADSIWSLQPNLTVQSVATSVSNRFKDDPKFGAAANTIRAQIKKPDGLHCTPSGR